MSVLKNVIRSDLVQHLAAWTTVRYVRTLPHLGHCVVHNQSTLDDLINRDQPFIACYWHSRMLMFPYVWPYDTRMHFLISRHRDGALLSRASAVCGFETIAGSTSRGGTEALRAMLRVLKTGECVSVTPDGPRGPRMRVSPGVVHAARLAGVPIVPIGFAASRCKILNSWDRFIVPLPFAAFAIEIGDPIEIDKKAGDEEVESVRNTVEERLLRLTGGMERQVGQTPIDPAPAPAAPDTTGTMAQAR